MARFHPPDHAKGDANTLGGYMAVHDRPAAFEGSDGFSYSVEIVADHTGDGAAAFGAYLLFVRWARIGAQSPEGHLESDYLTSGGTEGEARAALGGWKLDAVRAVLERLIEARQGAAPGRKWWDAMRDEGAGNGEDSN